MSDLYQKVGDMQGMLEKLVNKIPGFGGYIEKEKRREADRLLRDTIANRYGEQLGRLSRVQNQLIGSGGIEYLDDVQDAILRLQRFIDMTKTAPMGYSGFFDAVKVKEAELAKLYAFDNALLENAGKVSEAVGALEAAVGTDGLSGAIRQLVTLVAECNTTLERRKEVLTS